MNLNHTENDQKGVSRQLCVIMLHEVSDCVLIRPQTRDAIDTNDQSNVFLALV